jgi:hypothetical protein
MPESWTGYRDIDMEINLDDINRNMGLDGSQEASEEEEEAKK